MSVHDRESGRYRQRMGKGVIGEERKGGGEGGRKSLTVVLDGSPSIDKP